MTLSEVFQSYAVEIGGLIGAGVAVALGRVKLKPVPFAVAVGSGWMVAQYGTPLVLHVYPAMDTAAGSVAFFIGLIGLYLAGGILGRFKRFHDGDASLSETLNDLTRKP